MAQPNQPLLGIYYKDAVSCSRDMCTSRAIAALFTVARNWNQPTHPSTGEKIMTMWYVCRVEFYSDEKKSEITKVLEKMERTRKRYF